MDALPVVVLYDWRGAFVLPMDGGSPHSFGGRLLHPELSMANTGRRVHRLYCLDTRDPLLPVSILKVQKLVLYYSFDPGIDEFGYRFLEDGSLEVYGRFDDSRDTADGTSSDVSHPEAFDEVPVALKDLEIVPTRMEDVDNFSPYFGVRRLSPEIRAAFYERVKESYEAAMGEPLDPDEDFAPMEFGYLPQGRPLSSCPNPKCGHTPMEIVAFVPAHPVPGVSLWGEHGSDVVIVFELCSQCSAIRATNQCT